MGRGQLRVDVVSYKTNQGNGGLVPAFKGGDCRRDRSLGGRRSS